MDRTEAMKYAERGAELRRHEKQPLIEDAICGFIDTREPWWAAQMLMDLYEHVRDREVPVRIGDRVRMKPEEWWRGRSDRKSGWAGYIAMFADETAEVSRIYWDQRDASWTVEVVYENAYFWSDYVEDFYVKDGSRTFMFDAGWVEKA